MKLSKRFEWHLKREKDKSSDRIQSWYPHRLRLSAGFTRQLIDKELCLSRDWMHFCSIIASTPSAGRNMAESQSHCAPNNRNIFIFVSFIPANRFQQMPNMYRRRTCALCLRILRFPLVRLQSVCAARTCESGAIMITMTHTHTHTLPA